MWRPAANGGCRAVPEQVGGAMSRTLWAWVRLLAAAAILVVLVRHVGAGPFLDGLRKVSAWSLVSAVVLTLVTTVCSAWRWRAVARGLGVSLPLPAAITAYSRSQSINTVLPGGILGNVHRTISHGRQDGDVGRGPCAVVWDC